MKTSLKYIMKSCDLNEYVLTPLVVSLNTTWRCGVFLPEPDTVGEPPLAKYFVLQNHYPASCPATFKQTYKKGTFSKKCTQLVRDGVKVEKKCHNCGEGGGASTPSEDQIGENI